MRLGRRWTNLTASFAVACSSFAGICRADVVDQQQLGASSGFPTDSWAQTFRPSVNAITGFDLDFFNANGSPFYFQLRKVSDNSILVQTIPVILNNGVQHIQLPTPVGLVPETDYELRIFDSTPSFFGDYAVFGVAGDAYSRGTARFPGGGNESPPRDLYFATYVPEPGTAVLVGVGSLGLLGVRRRRG